MPNSHHICLLFSYVLDCINASYWNQRRERTISPLWGAGNVLILIIISPFFFMMGVEFEMASRQYDNSECGSISEAWISCLVDHFFQGLPPPSSVHSTTRGWFVGSASLVITSSGMFTVRLSLCECG